MDITYSIILTIKICSSFSQKEKEKKKKCSSTSRWQREGEWDLVLS